jgi:2-hydroxychromene-2-carboxylate isomerase
MRIVDEVGLSERHLDVAIEDPAIKAALSNATNAAIEAGVFGVPTMALNGELFWGADRVETLLWRLENPKGDLAALEVFLQHPASASRNRH